MNVILSEATEAIRSHQYNFLYTSEVQRAFRALERGIKDRTEETDTLMVSIPAAKIADHQKLQWLPLPVKEDVDNNGNRILCFDWFTMPEKHTGFGVVTGEFVSTLIKALNDLPTAKAMAHDEIEAIKEKYAPGMKLRIIKMVDDYKMEMIQDGQLDLYHKYIFHERRKV